MPRISLCELWEYTAQWDEAFARFESPAQAVRLPHTAAEVPLHYARPFEMLCGYRRQLFIPNDIVGKRLFLQFDGAGHIATVYINGSERLTHRCGYTGFRLEITDDVKPGENIRIAVKLDTTENPSIPPFGHVVDYLTYGGLYREVWLDIRERSYLEDVAIVTPELDQLQIRPKVFSSEPGQILKVRVLDAAGISIQSDTAQATAPLLTLRVPNAVVWNTERPYLYQCETTLLDCSGHTLDKQVIPFGFRTAAFRADGFYLNGERLFLRGLNRHQCYPYVGYAAPERLQREDARILKQELGCNMVRTSHYPQSHYFLDECDRLGLLVFTEIPGWQHVGDQTWKEQACQNVTEMIEQYRNHTSIVLWGVRINESLDDDDFYRRTNAIAHALDPSRATSGVRYIEKSSLLEDVYAYNDFSHTGDNAGVKPKKKVTPDMHKALIISECNGHMYPTKSFDPWAHRQEQALRHARVQDASASDGGHAGCLGWCMFDYPTHQDFGSGDRVCYHGVMDAFRNPKLAAAVYACQSAQAPVLEIGSTMDIGDYPGGKIDPVYVFTNAEKVALYKNDNYVITLTQKGWKGLPHGPILLDDTIGCLLETVEGFPKRKAKILHRCLISAKQHGLAGLPLMDKLRMLYCMVHYKMSFQDGVDLYGKYVGNWGGVATRWRFDAMVGEKVIATTMRGPVEKLHLEVKSSHVQLEERASYDMAAIRVRILDQYGALAPYAQLPVVFRLDGAAKLVGPQVATAEGGMCGTYVRTIGQAGTAKLTISAGDLENAEIFLSIELKNQEAKQ